MRTQAVIETAIYVNALQAAETFYRTVLGPRGIGKDSGRHVFVQVGEIVLLSEDEARVQMVPTLQTTLGVTHQHLPYFSPPFKKHRRIPPSSAPVLRRFVWLQESQ